MKSRLLVITVKKSWSNPILWSFCPMFSSKNFFLDPAFRSLIYFALLLYMLLCKHPTLHMNIQFSQDCLLKRLSWEWGCGSSGRALSMHEALGSIPSTTKREVEQVSCSHLWF
jgi:hypothetical protein